MKSSQEVVSTYYTNIEPQDFRNIIGHFMSGVSVITTTLDDKQYGLTASAVTSLSLEPPMLIVCINQNAGTSHAISQTKQFVVNILREEQGSIAKQFAIPSDDKFKGIEVEKSTTGLPVLADCHVSIECELVEEHIGGTHKIFIGRPTEAIIHEQSEPLAYYRGQFGKFIQE
ncbi:MAG TPA: flavin reductase family protein [Ureibacillus sp.]|nr:flavin reductase family protein [Ureibacillus sp.]